VPEPTALPFDPIEEARRQWLDHGWADAADGMALSTSIVRAQRILLDRIDGVLRPMRVTFARYELLVLLDFSSNGALPLGKIGARLQVHAASVTNAVDRLEADGLVQRVPHPDDGRATLATITPSGRRLARRATKALNEQVFSNLGFGSDEAASMFAALSGFRRDAGDFA
jgi:DNA-binding MarR family transcriptional regulator